MTVETGDYTTVHSLVVVPKVGGVESMMDYSS